MVHTRRWRDKRLGESFETGAYCNRKLPFNKYQATKCVYISVWGVKGVLEHFLSAEIYE